MNDTSDGEDEVYDYDIAAPRLRLHQNKSTCLGVCVKSLVLVFLAVSIETILIFYILTRKRRISRCFKMFYCFTKCCPVYRVSQVNLNTFT